MTVALVYDPEFAEYRFPASHPMRPERFTLAVELMRGWGLLAEEPAEAGVGVASPELTPMGVPRAPVWRPEPASQRDLLLFHTSAYVSAVQAASVNPLHDAPSMGLGDGDTPPFFGMHEAAALAVGGTMLALDAVLADKASRAFNPAGGLHHAQRDRASGFCIYNDCAIAIEHATRERDGLRIAYVDIDAHHGDGVEAAFHARKDVLTLSVHESGRYLFPGTGGADDIGEGAGVGYTVNVPLPPGADPPCYELVFREIIQPAVRHFDPDVIVAQIGADSHVADPLTHLRQTVAGHVALVGRIIALAEESCDGRIVLTGGGGYEPFSVVPRIWAGAMAVLMGSDVPSQLPPAWIAAAQDAAASYGLILHAPQSTFDEPEGSAASADVSAAASDFHSSETALLLTQQAVNRVRAASPLLGGGR